MSTEVDHDVRPAHASALRAFTSTVCVRLGADEDVAAEVSEHLVDADLCGHGSHGLMRLCQYAAEADRGDLLPGARPELAHSFGATAILDARRGFGHFSTTTACDLAMRTAAEHGVCAVAVRHSTHIGRLGRYCEQIAYHGMVGLLTVGAAGPGVGAVALPGTTDRFVAANPWAIGVPTADAPVIVDVSTSMLAEGKVSVAAARRGTLPDGCIVDALQRPSRAPADYFDGGALLPLGGTAVPHKGFGLALGAAMLGALATIGDPHPTLAGSQRPAGSAGTAEIGGVLLIVIAPEAFGGTAEFGALLGPVLTEILCAESRGARITVPGEPERRQRKSRSGTVELPAAVVADLISLADRFGLAHCWN